MIADEHIACFGWATPGRDERHRRHGDPGERLPVRPVRRRSASAWSTSSSSSAGSGTNDFARDHPRRRDQPRRLPAVGHDDQARSSTRTASAATSAARPRPIRKSPAGSACCPRARTKAGARPRHPPQETRQVIAVPLRRQGPSPSLQGEFCKERKGALRATGPLPSQGARRGLLRRTAASIDPCMSLRRARVLVMNSALGPLDYRVPHGMQVEPGSVVVAPLGPRQLLGVVWEPERMPSDGGRRQPPAQPGRRLRRRRRSPRRCAGWSNGPPIIISRRPPRCCAWRCRPRPRSKARAPSPNIARPATSPTA